jgi:hypothetical protein
MSEEEKKAFEVATFCDKKETRISKVNAYTGYYNPCWDGYKMFVVEAVSDSEAKKIAKKLRLEWERRN